GSIVADTWTPGMDNPQSRQFVEAYEKKYDRMPSAYAAFSYDAAMLLNAAVKSLNGDVSDKKAFSKAIKNAKFESVRGDFKFGKNNYPVQNYHIFKVVQKDSKPGFEMLQKGVLNAQVDP